MKLENFKRAESLVKQLDDINNAICDIKSFLADKEEYTGTTTAKKTVYGFHIASHRDGSGQIVDLTGIGIGVTTLNFILGSLEAKRDEVQAEIATL